MANAIDQMKFILRRLSISEELIYNLAEIRPKCNWYTSKNLIKKLDAIERELLQNNELSDEEKKAWGNQIAQMYEKHVRAVDMRDIPDEEDEIRRIRRNNRGGGAAKFQANSKPTVSQQPFRKAAPLSKRDTRAELEAFLPLAKELIDKTSNPIDKLHELATVLSKTNRLLSHYSDDYWLQSSMFDVAVELIPSHLKGQYPHKGKSIEELKEFVVEKIVLHYAEMGHFDFKEMFTSNGCPICFKCQNSSHATCKCPKILATLCLECYRPDHIRKVCPYRFSSNIKNFKYVLERKTEVAENLELAESN